VLAAAVGCAAFPVATAVAAARSPFFTDVTCMSVKRKEAARAAPTINVMTGVAIAIFMPRGTQRGAYAVQRFRRT
jgi:hypothetical protein